MNLLSFIGSTPLVEIKNPYGQGYGKIYVKLEEFNAGGSIKSRVAIQMINDAEEKGDINKNINLIEPTGGNTGIGLAIASAIKGYNLTLVIPNTFSSEKIGVLENLGARVILSDHHKSNKSHILKCEEILKNDSSYMCLNQFENLSNPRAHYLGTGQEIVDELKGEISCFVCGVGSGGTIVGVSKRLREVNDRVIIYGVQPAGCNILKSTFIPHKIQAIAVGIRPVFLSDDTADGFIDVKFGDVQKTREYISKTHGIFVGFSSGANIFAAIEISRKFKNNENIVTVAPDSGRSYLEYEK